MVATAHSDIIESANKSDLRKFIHIKGARSNNLKNIELFIPKNKLVVVTGVSGSGKSSLVDELVRRFLIEVKDKTLAIISVDPSKRKTGGALLGDRIRMNSINNSRVYMRSMATRQTNASISKSITDAIAILEAANYDLIIIDEASMIDLRMASQLITAIHPQSRVILLGDANQLAAVEAGAVLAEIGKAKTLKESCVHLTHSQRFGGQIGQLAEAVCRGDSQQALHIAKQNNQEEVFYHSLEQPEVTAKKLFSGYQAFVSALQHQQTITQILAAFDEYRVLCAVREGAYGVNAINQRLSNLLQKELKQSEEGAIWYHGRPIMVTQNDYSLDIFNGDIGITLAEEDGFYVYFPARDAQHKRISAARLAHSETALALTIHKSQGSEFKQVAVLLPKEDSAILSRQLLYTGITRAKKQIHLWAIEKLFSKAVEQETQRAAGLHIKIDQ